MADNLVRYGDNLFLVSQSDGGIGSRRYKVKAWLDPVDSSLRWA